MDKQPPRERMKEADDELRAWFREHPRFRDELAEWDAIQHKRTVALRAILRAERRAS